LKTITIAGIILVAIMVLGFFYPLIVMQTYISQREVKFRSLVKTIYNNILENILVKSNKTTMLSLNDTALILKLRSSIIKASSYNGKLVKIVLTPLKNIPSEYMLFNENGRKIVMIIGYFVEVYLPEKMKYLEFDGRLSYISITLEKTAYGYLKASFLGSIVEFALNNSLINTVLMRLDESLMESYIDLQSLNFTGELSLELESYTSIIYSYINIGNDTRIRVVRENIGGVEEVNIDESRLYEYYYIDPGYYESGKRLHIAVKGFGSGIRIDLNRVG